MKATNVLVLLILIKLSLAFKVVQFQPEQVHLSLGDDGSSFVVTWSTWNFTQARALVGLHPFNMSTRLTGAVKSFSDDGEEHSTQFIHTVTINFQEYDTYHYYRVGSDVGWSEMFWFKSFPAGFDWAPKLAILGDMGNVNAQSLPRLQLETQQGMYDMVIHNGDFAYDFHEENGRIGDEFMKQIEPVAAYVPYMTSSGNHEAAYNFSHYKARFTMPNDLDERMYFSFNVGPVHFISVCTELYYYTHYGIELIEYQYEWLTQDLIEANREENRSKQPWIIIYGHRPMYCSDKFDTDCLDINAKTRVGILMDGQYKYGIEPLMKQYNIDLGFWAHEHNYERFWPMYDYNFFNTSDAHIDPKAPVHITSGSAGCDEVHDPFGPMPDMTAFRNNDYGYVRLYAYNSSHLEIEAISDDANGQVIDHLWLISYDHKFEETSFS